MQSSWPLTIWKRGRMPVSKTQPVQRDLQEWLDSAGPRNQRNAKRAPSTQRPNKRRERLPTAEEELMGMTMEFRSMGERYRFLLRIKGGRFVFSGRMDKDGALVGAGRTPLANL